MATVCLVAAVMLVGLRPTSALPSDQFGVYPLWTTAGSSGAFTATASFVPSAGFPALSLSTDSTTIRAPSGETAWLGTSTAFGTEFGASRSQPYLSLALAAGASNSTTTVSFDAAPPDGWGFALGDIDADWVFIQAWQDAGRTLPLTPAELGFEGAGNYCNSVPKPSACGGTGPFTDAPVWVTAAETFDGISYVPGTLRGNSLPGAPAATRDTAGAYGWFRPTAPILSMDLLFGQRDGLPAYQLWLASPAPKVVISGAVVLDDQPAGGPIPPATTVTLLDADGTPVPGITGQPITYPVESDGTFSLETEQRDAYQIVINPPAGYVTPPPVLIPALAAIVTVPPIALSSTEPSEPTPKAPPSMSPAPSLPVPMLPSTNMGRPTELPAPP